MSSVQHLRPGGAASSCACRGLPSIPGPASLSPARSTVAPLPQAGGGKAVGLSRGLSSLDINQEAHGFVSPHSLDVSPQVESGLAALPHHHPCSPCAPAPPTAPLLSTNLGAAASPAAAAAAAIPEATPSGFSGLTNPFLTSLQSNPFFEELIADIALNSPSPAPSLPSASRANPTPLASPGKALPEWDDTFNIFAASRLRPEARSEILAPPGAGLEATGLQDPGLGAMTMKAAELQGDPGGGERGGSSVWLEPRVPPDLGLDCSSTSVADPGPLGSEGACLPPASAQLHPGASASGADRELPAPGGEAGQSPADSATSLFSSPEVISVWERLPGPDSFPEAHQDQETCRGGSQVFHELDTVDDSWPWDVVTVSPAAETTSPVLQGGSSDELPPPQMQPRSPEPVSPQRSGGLPPPEPDSESKPEWELDQGLQPQTPPPKPPRLFTPSDSQEKEAAAAEEEKKAEAVEEEAVGGLSRRGSETGEEDVIPRAPIAGPQEAEQEEEAAQEEEAQKPELESDSHSSGATLGGPGPDLAEGASPPAVSGPCLSVPASCPQGPAPTPHYSKSLALQQMWGTPKREDPEAQCQDPAGEGPGFLTGSRRQAGLRLSEEDALNPFTSQGSQDPPSLPSTSPPGSRESSIRSGPEELPTPPEPALPPPHLPPGASHHHGSPSPPCSPLPGAWTLTSSSLPPGEPASPTGSPPTPLGEDHAAGTPASPLALLPLETRPAEDPQPSAR